MAGLLSLLLAELVRFQLLPLRLRSSLTRARLLARSICHPIASARKHQPAICQNLVWRNQASREWLGQGQAQGFQRYYCLSLQSRQKAGDGCATVVPLQKRWKLHMLTWIKLKRKEHFPIKLIPLRVHVAVRVRVRAVSGRITAQPRTNCKFIFTALITPRPRKALWQESWITPVQRPQPQLQARAILLLHQTGTLITQVQARV